MEMNDDVKELEVSNPTTSASSAEQHGGGGLEQSSAGRIELELKPVVERKSKAMGVRKRVYQTLV